MFETRVTDMLGIEYPIIQGGMQWLATAELAAAVSNAGGLGLISAFTFSSTQELKEEIRKTRSFTDKPFGVNISLFPTAREYNIDAIIDTVIDEGVEVVETAGRNPVEYIDRLKKANIKVIHKVPAVRHARTAERIGVDAVTVVGFECGGHPGMESVTSLVLIPRTVDSVKIPVVAGGGFGDARGFVAALALGAEAVLMGTRFVATKECMAHLKIKEWMVNAKETDTTTIMHSQNAMIRVMKTESAERVLNLEDRQAAIEDLLPIVGGERGRDMLTSGDLSRGVLACGQVVGLVNELLSVKEVIEGIISGAKDILGRLESFR